MTLYEAVAVFWPDGPLTVTSLRTEIRKNHLSAERIAGKLFVTPKTLRDMRRKCRTEMETIEVRSDISRELATRVELNRAQAALKERVAELRASLRKQNLKNH